MQGPSTPRGYRPMTTDAYPDGVTPADFERIGRALVGAACTMVILGHEGPGGMADYVNPDDMPGWQERFVLDMVALTHGIGRSDRKEAALDRVHGFVWQSGQMDEAAEAMSR